MNKSVSVILIAILTMASFGFILGTAKAATEIQKQWVGVQGQIQQYGTTSAIGWLEAHAEMKSVNGTTVLDKAEAHAMWFPGITYTITPEGPWNITRPKCNITRSSWNITHPMPSFTFSFYAAWLVKSSAITLNTSAVATNNFIINGTWDAVNVTFVQYPNIWGKFDCVNKSMTIQPIVTNATGALSVFGNWTKFELNITGLNLVTGVVQHYFVGSMQLIIGDFNGEGKVDILDLVEAAHAFGSMPGIGSYSFNLDLTWQSDGFQIGIGDLTTIAAQIS